MPYLRECRRKEKDIRARDRMTSHMQRKEGKTVAEIAAIVNRSKSIARDRLVRAQEEGMRGGRGRGGRGRGGRGRKCRPDGAQPRQLSADLDGGPGPCGSWSGQRDSGPARQHVKEKFGAEHTKSRMRDIMKGLKFSRGKPRPRNPGAASKKK